ncbi:MAG: FAD-binding oxidoreductase, partial [Synechocystis sp.]
MIDIAPFLNSVPGNSLQGLRNLDRRWQDLCQGKLSPPPQVVHTVPETLGGTDVDGVICGGTLGILLAASLQMKGWRIAVIERGILRGRDQEWNISRHELQTFLDLGLLTQTELETAIATEYNPARIAFKDGIELWVKDVLNVGVDPVYLLETLKQKFLQAGGMLWGNSAVQMATIHPDGVKIHCVDQLTQATKTLTAQLLMDAMGHGSPLVQQARQGERPD